MIKFIVGAYETIMDSNINPLSKIPDHGVRHLVMQVLAWMWCIVFSFYVGSITVFGISAIAHALLIAALFVTIGTFATASHNPTALVKGYHTMSRARKYMWVDGKRYDLPDNDPGGEHN
jgi:hypothetical protein